MNIKCFILPVIFQVGDLRVFWTGLGFLCASGCATLTACVQRWKMSESGQRGEDTSPRVAPHGMVQLSLILYLTALILSPVYSASLLPPEPTGQTSHPLHSIDLSVSFCFTVYRHVHTGNIRDLIILFNNNLTNCNYAKSQMINKFGNRVSKAQSLMFALNKCDLSAFLWL